MHIRNVGFCLALIVLSGLFCAGIARSQEPAFRIDSYIPQYFTDFQWRLEGYFSAEGYRQEGKSIHDGEENDYKSIISLDKQTIQISSDIDYRFETIPRFFNVTVRGAYFLDNVTPHNRRGYWHDSDPGIFPTVDAGYYLHSDLLAFISGSLGWVYSHNLHDVNPDTRRIEYSIDAVTGLGWGRTYDGRFAATAVYIVDALKGKSILNRMPTFDEMDSLTEIVYTRRLESYDDFRLHQIASLLSIMNFLEGKGIVNPTGPYGYLLIQDVWNYFPKDSRRFGWIFKAGVGLDYFKQLVQTTDEHEGEFGTPMHLYIHREELDQQPFVFLRADYLRPWNLHWQMNAFLEYKYFLKSYDLSREDKYNYQPSQPTLHRELRKNYSAFYRVSTEASVNYIFDSRTSAVATVGYVRLHYNSDFQYNGVESGILSARMTVDYRISIPTTLQVALEYYREDKSETWGYAGKVSEDILDYYEYFTGIRLIHYLF